MKTQNPLIGRSRKSYGDATFYTLNGQNIVRTKPMVVSNPNTPAQQAQRIRFGAFTRAANSMSEADLNLLFKNTEVGRNRRSMLQAQLAPAFGSQPTTDPTAAEKYEATFNIAELGDIGSGPVGYIGDTVECTQNSQSLLEFTPAQINQMIGNMVGYNVTDKMLIVAISEDGCILRVLDSEMTIAEASAISEGDTLQIENTEFAQHGDKVHCYAIGGKLQLIGLGTFSVAERPARKGHDPRHAKPV